MSCCLTASAFHRPPLLDATSRTVIDNPVTDYAEGYASQAAGESNIDSRVVDLHDAVREAPATSFDFDAPKSLSDALSRPDAKEWADAITNKRLDVPTNFADGLAALERAEKHLVPSNVIVKRSLLVHTAKRDGAKRDGAAYSVDVVTAILRKVV